MVVEVATAYRERTCDDDSGGLCRIVTLLYVASSDIHSRHGKPSVSASHTVKKNSGPMEVT